MAVTASAARPQEMVFRRPPEPGEDKAWYEMSQSGRHIPSPEPKLVPFGIAPLFVHYPLARKSARLIVFSHSALADPISYRPLLQHIVSHGFVVVAPQHDDSVFKGGLLARTASNKGAATWDVDRVLNDVFAWEARAEACRSAIEHPELVAAAIGMDIDVERPIIAGHEFGAYVAGVLMGATVAGDDAKLVAKLVDPRWYAALMMSPQGAGIMGLNEQSWLNVNRPLMVIQGALESDFTLQDPAKKIDPFRLSAPGNKHLAWFKRGDRGFYNGPRVGLTKPAQVITEDLHATVTAFLSAYGDYDEVVFSKLTTGWIDQATLGRVQTQYR